MLILLRSWDNEDDVKLREPGLGGRELLLSESPEDMVSGLVLDLDWVDFDRRIWLCRRLMGGIGGRLVWEWLRRRESVDSD